MDHHVLKFPAYTVTAEFNFEESLTSSEQHGIVAGVGDRSFLLLQCVSPHVSSEYDDTVQILEIHSDRMEFKSVAEIDGLYEVLTSL